MSNTGFKAYTNLEQYYVDNGIATGVTKTNSISDPDYVAPIYDTVYCPLPSLSATPTPTVTSTPSVTPTVTPTVTPSISATPSISVTPTVTPSITVSTSIPLTPSATPTISVTPTVSLTPTVTPSSSGNPLLIYVYTADRYICFDGNLNYFDTVTIQNTDPITIEYGKYYFDYTNCMIFTISSTSTNAPTLFTNIIDPPVANGLSLCYVPC
jgi:hypothetical protein